MNIPQNRFEQTFSSNSQTQSLAKTFMTTVFGWMFLALGITAVTAYLFASSESLLSLMYNETGMSILGWVVMLAPFGLVMFMSFKFQTMSRANLSFMFLIYSILMGMSLSFILLIYTQASVFSTFIVTSGTFGLMAVLGYTTNTDLTKFGSILFMALIGIILASLVNFFMHSGTLEYIISIVGVLIFTGLTAYDVQKLKRIGMATGEYAGESKDKLAIMGALTLYLDFINLFLFLLRFMGNRK
ncbi:MAG: BAX inhibitor (BI)-1/YccA family protein [Bacteroidetes bacterium]|nr:MAG: BAX inhibitor (BI)-1/YccA family protein [Bacteroidota bacterium]